MQLCEIGLHRLTFKRPGKYKHGHGLICQGCYDREKRARVKQLQPATPAKREPVRNTPLLQTPERLNHLRDTIHAHSIGQQGRSRSADQNAMMLLSLHEAAQLATPDTPPNRIIAAVARSHLMSANTVRAASERYQQRMELLATVKPMQQRLKRNDPQHPLFLECGPSLSVQKLLYEKIAESQANNTFSSLRTLRLDIKEDLGVDVAKSTLQSWMAPLGFVYDEKKLSGLPAEVAAAFTRRFIHDYAAAIAEEKAGKAVIVWMDESYIHQHYCTKFGWHLAAKDRAVPNRFVGKDSGPRLIIIHAMTKDGMLQLAKSNDPSNDLSEQYPNAMVVAHLVSAEGIEPADYHDTIDGTKFIAWMKNRLIPAFKRKYRGKKMILIMDNAKYHHARGEDWMTPAEMNRGQCADFLRQVDVKKIRGSVRGRDKSFASSSYSAEEKNGGPTLKLLRGEIDNWLQSHPEANVEVPTQLVRDVREGSRIVYTPWLQPIELVWNQAKQQVALGACRNRQLDEMEEATKTALRSVTAQACLDTIDHVHRFIDAWLKTVDAGWLRPFGSLAQLVAASAEEREVAYRRFMDGATEVESDESEKENQPSAAAAADSERGSRKRQKKHTWHSTVK